MQQPNDWIEWEGGECPLPYEAEVEVKFRDGVTDIFSASDLTPAAFGGASTPDTDNWMHNGGSSDIIAYRLAKASS